jgi:DNA polymerase-3 subunit epsilon
VRFPWIGLSDDGKSVRLERLEGGIVRPAHADDAWLKEHKAELRTAVFLDTETTGLDVRRDVILELAMRAVVFDRRNGEFLYDDGSFVGLQDPGRPLTAKVKQITGFDDAMLKGKAIDWTEADRLLSRADVIVAHNASFDRPLVDRSSKASGSKVWGCTKAQIDWLGKGFGAEKLDLLCIYHGFFIDSHRAMNDVDGMIGLTGRRDAATGKPYFNELLGNARKELCRVMATDSPISTKDLLKERGYSWDVNARVWHKTIPSSDLVAERAWLTAEIYKGSYRGKDQPLRREDTFKSF